MLSDLVHRDASHRINDEHAGDEIATEPRKVRRQMVDAPLRARRPLGEGRLERQGTGHGRDHGP